MVVFKPMISKERQASISCREIQPNTIIKMESMKDRFRDTRATQQVFYIIVSPLDLIPTWI